MGSWQWFSGFHQEAAPHLCLLFISQSKATGLMPRDKEATVTSHPEGGMPDTLGWQHQGQPQNPFVENVSFHFSPYKQKCSEHLFSILLFVPVLLFSKNKFITYNYCVKMFGAKAATTSHRVSTYRLAGRCQLVGG